jgi:hypothetical protein
MEKKTIKKKKKKKKDGFPAGGLVAACLQQLASEAIMCYKNLI